MKLKIVVLRWKESESSFPRLRFGYSTQKYQTRLKLVIIVWIHDFEFTKSNPNKGTLGVKFTLLLIFSHYNIYHTFGCTVSMIHPDVNFFSRKYTQKGALQKKLAIEAHHLAELPLKPPFSIT